MTDKRNVSIQLIRIVTMFMIIFDHILSWIEFPMKSIILQICNSGVLIFLLISGYLYGNKLVENWKNWFFHRLMRICIPLWIFMLVDFIVEALLWDNFNIRYIFIYAFNLQGILGVTTGGTTLWFLTLIMICYLITPALQWIKRRNPGKRSGIIILLIAIIVQAVLAYTTNAGIVAGHALSWCVIAIGMYVAGYFIGNVILSEKMGKKRTIISTIPACAAAGTVLLLHRWFDGQVIYDRIVIYYGMVVIDLWICTVLYCLGRYAKSEQVYCVMNHLDTISYEFYIVYELIIAAITQPLIGKIGVVAYICATIILSFVGAWTLHGVCRLIYRKVQ